MIPDYLRGPGPRAGHLGRLKSSHVLNLISSIKLKNKTFIIFQLREREGLPPHCSWPTPTLLMALTWREGSNILYIPFLNTL